MFSFCAYFQGIQSDVRTSSGMFLSPNDRTYPIVQVGPPKSTLFFFILILTEYKSTLTK